MKVYIGPYKNWIGPYQISGWLKHLGFAEEDRDRIGDWLAKTWVNDFCEWIESKRKRKIKIRIDKYDTWNFDSTLAPIILPMLKQLKDTKHGSGFIDLEDVPEEMRYTETENWDTQLTFDFYNDNDTSKQKLNCDVHTRFDWVLDEMIWAFEQLQPDCDWEKQYWRVQPEIDFEALETDKPSADGTKELKWKVKGDCDWEGRQKHQYRINNGLRLFGKYFCTLWD